MELLGKTVLITRAAAQSQELKTALEALGARVLESPAIEIVPVEDWTLVDQAAERLSSYNWLIFTSSNAVKYFMERVVAKSIVIRTPIAVIGTSTAEKLEEWNLAASRIPANFRAEGLLEMFAPTLDSVRILIPRAESARELLPDELRKRGASVDVVTVYRTRKSEAGMADLLTTLREEHIDALVFMSPSAIRSFAETLGGDLTGFLTEIPIAVIGPIAREALVSVGLKATIEPDRATVADLVESIRAYFSTRTPST